MKNNIGFTLIEVIIYLALLSIIFGGVAVAVYGIIESTGREAGRIQLQTEGDFLLAKINWAFSGAANLTVSTLPPVLTINKYLYQLNPIVFDASSTKMRIKESNFLPEDLNNKSVNLTNLTFQNLPSSNQTPEGVKISFSLSTSLSGSRIITKNFQENLYLFK